MLKNDRFSQPFTQEGNLNDFFRRKVRKDENVAIPIKLFRSVFGIVTSTSQNIYHKVDKINEKYLVMRKAA